MTEPGFSMDEVIAEIKKYISEDEGFCTSEIKVALRLTRGQVGNLMQRLRDLGLIEPAGRKRLMDVHGITTTRPCWRWVDEADEPE